MTQPPFISVIIPAYNEEKYIRDCLYAVQNQHTRYSYEIIVVDNNSTDSTAEIAQSFGCTLIHEPVKGYSRAVTGGIQEARGKILCLMDADTRVPPMWMETIGDLFVHNVKTVCVGGPAQFYDGSRTIQKSMDFMYKVAAGLSLLQPMGFNMAFRTSYYSRVAPQLVHTNLQWDRHLVILLKTLGNVHFLPALSVKTSSRRWQTVPRIFKEASIRLVNTVSLFFTRRTLYQSFDDYR